MPWLIPFCIICACIPVTGTRAILSKVPPTCCLTAPEKHHIPADKCTPEIYQQLKAKDNAPLDPTSAVLRFECVSILGCCRSARRKDRIEAALQVEFSWLFLLRLHPDTFPRYRQ